MNKFSNWKPALLIGVSIVLLGAFIKSGIVHVSDSSRIVTVRGLCEKEVKANKVTWPIVTKEMGNELTVIYDKIQKTNSTILAFLKNNGLSEKEILVNPPQVNDRLSDAYDTNNVKYRYQVTNVIVVTSDNVDLVQKLMEQQTELLRQGIAIVAGDYQYQTEYEYTDLNSIKPEMIAEATKNARAAADKFASDSQSDLGKIKSASQGQFSINDRDMFTPSIKTIRVVTYIDYYLKD